jgi:hypothetical protein
MEQTINGFEIDYLGLVLIEIITIWFWKLLIFGPGGWSASALQVYVGLNVSI